MIYKTKVTPTYLKYKYFFYFELRSDPELDPDLFSAETDLDPRKKKSDSHPLFL